MNIIAVFNAVTTGDVSLRNLGDVSLRNDGFTWRNQFKFFAKTDNCFVMSYAFLSRLRKINKFIRDIRRQENTRKEQENIREDNSKRLCLSNMLPPFDCIYLKFSVSTMRK
jgi:hypothetical protein